MKININDIDIINALIIIAKKIEECYKMISISEYRETLSISLRQLIKEENRLIKKLDLTFEKLEEIKKKISREYKIRVNINMPILYNKDLTGDNYPYFRVIKKCTYSLMTAETLCITLDDVRKEFVDLETGLIFNSLINESKRQTDKNASIKLQRMAYYSLADSPVVEEQLLANALEPTFYVANTIRMVIEYIVDKQAEIVSNMFAGEVVFEDKSVIDIVDGDDDEKKALIDQKYAHKQGLILLVDRDTYDIRYEEVINERFDETFMKTYKVLERMIKNNKNYMYDVMFYVILTYLKIVVSILPNEKRKEIYENIKDDLIKKGIFTKYENLYVSAISDIENNILEQICTVKVNIKH